MSEMVSSWHGTMETSMFSYLRTSLCIISIVNVILHLIKSTASKHSTNILYTTRVCYSTWYEKHNTCINFHSMWYNYYKKSQFIVASYLLYGPLSAFWQLLSISFQTSRLAERIALTEISIQSDPVGSGKPSLLLRYFKIDINKG